MTEFTCKKIEVYLRNYIHTVDLHWPHLAK